MVVVDTNVIIDHLRLRGQNSHLINVAEKLPQEKFALSVISIQELYEGKSTKEFIRVQEMLTTISLFKILAYTYEIAELAGTILRDLGRPIDFTNAAISATAIIDNCRLFTLNKKDFQGIKGLELI